MIDIIDPQRINPREVKEFIKDLNALQKAMERPLSDLTMLVAKGEAERDGREPSPYHITFKMIKEELELLELRLNTVKKEMPKVLANLQLASQLRRVA